MHRRQRRDRGKEKNSKCFSVRLPGSGIGSSVGLGWDALDPLLGWAAAGWAGLGLARVGSVACCASCQLEVKRSNADTVNIIWQGKDHERLHAVTVRISYLLFSS